MDDKCNFFFINDKYYFINADIKVESTMPKRYIPIAIIRLEKLLTNGKKGTQWKYVAGSQTFLQNKMDK